MLQPTQVQHVHRDSVSDASRLLDLDGLAVERVESDAFGGRVVHVVTADETASACPGCGVFSCRLANDDRRRWPHRTLRARPVSRPSELALAEVQVLSG